MARIDQFIFNAIAHARNKHYIVVYDITEDTERLKISDILIGFGIRIQYSVFECKLTKKQHGLLYQQLNNVAVKTGFIKIYRVEQQTKSLTIGIEKQGNIDLDEACIIV